MGTQRRLRKKFIRIDLWKFFRCFVSMLEIGGNRVLSGVVLGLVVWYSYYTVMDLNAAICKPAPAVSRLSDKVNHVSAILI